MNAPKCQQCDTEMEKGFVPDYHHKMSSRRPTWVSGSPETSWFSGLNIPDLQIPVTTYRCPICGRLESFALFE